MAVVSASRLPYLLRLATSAHSHSASAPLLPLPAELLTSDLAAGSQFAGEKGSIRRVLLRLSLHRSLYACGSLLAPPKT